jgi:outer membrane lipoprotein-sorting protein
MHIVFDHKQVGGKSLIPDRVEYLLEDGWLTIRTDATKTESRVQLVPQGQKVNLFQLGKSPFPMPIGQDRAEVEKQFDATRLPPAKDDPSGSIHLQLKPRTDSPMAERFSSIDLWTDLKTQMPVRIKTIDNKKVMERTTDLTGMRVNSELKPQDVSVPKLAPDWRSSDTPLAQ